MSKRLSDAAMLRMLEAAMEEMGREPDKTFLKMDRCAAELRARERDRRKLASELAANERNEKAKELRWQSKNRGIYGRKP